MSKWMVPKAVKQSLAALQRQAHAIVGPHGRYLARVGVLRVITAVAGH